MGVCIGVCTESVFIDEGFYLNKKRKKKKANIERKKKRGIIISRKNSPEEKEKFKKNRILEILAKLKPAVKPVKQD